VISEVVDVCVTTDEGDGETAAELVELVEFVDGAEDEADDDEEDESVDEFFESYERVFSVRVLFCGLSISSSASRSVTQSQPGSVTQRDEHPSPDAVFPTEYSIHHCQI